MDDLILVPRPENDTDFKLFLIPENVFDTADFTLDNDDFKDDKFTEPNDFPNDDCSLLNESPAEFAKRSIVVFAVPSDEETIFPIPENELESPLSAFDPNDENDLASELPNPFCTEVLTAVNCF
jgi:hypothetical protein